MQLINSSHFKLVHDLKAFLKAVFRRSQKALDFLEIKKKLMMMMSHYAQSTLATRGSGQMKPVIKPLLLIVQAIHCK